MNNPSLDAAFTCRRCGNCCQGQGGIVLTAADVHRLCRHLNTDPASFAGAYVETVNGKDRLRTNDQGWCIFFADGCAVHPAKPTICRAWPFFRGNMVDASSWAMAQDACPGINPKPGHAGFKAQGADYLLGLEVEPLTVSSPNALTDAAYAPSDPLKE